jgi:hypothetical protein
MLEEIRSYLISEGIPMAYAGQFASIVKKLILTWRPENPGNPDEAKAIVAFSYSYRFLSNGNRIPGPINELLAQNIIEHYEKFPRPIFAQWEIAKCFGAKIPLSRFCVINPEINLKKGIAEYLSTEGVLKSAMAQGLNPKEHNPILVIAQRFHLPRCVWLCELPEFGFKTVSDPDHMPDRYDPESGQLWTHEFMSQIVGDIISRFATYRDKVLLKEP